MPTQQQVNAARTLYVVQNGHQSVHNNYYQSSAFGLQLFVEAGSGDPASFRGQPSQLLLARNQVVSFAGRRSELDRLTGWRQASGHTSALLLYGPGGVGKTRLAAEFATRSAYDGWTVVVAQRSGGPGLSIGDVPASNAGHLIIVDYAERWPRTDLLALLSGVESLRSPSIRVLLLARSAAWWGNLSYPLRKQGVSVAVDRLPHLASNTTDRQSLFEAACASFAEACCITADGLEPVGSLDDSRYCSILTIHMAALAAVDARSRGGVPPDEPGALSTYLLDRERDHWATMRENDHIASRLSTMGRAVFLATLLGPMSREAAVRLLCDMKLASDEFAAQQVLDDHRVCYPPADHSTELEPLAPDRLGEDFLARNMPRPCEDYLSDPWALHVSARMLTAAVQSPHRPRAITVLAETGKRWRHVKHHLNQHLLQTPGQLVTIGGAALLAVADIADLSLLAAIEPHLPERDFDLDTAAARIIMRLTDQQLPKAGGPVALAQLHVKRGYRLGNAGDHDLARRETELAVDIYRSLVDSSPGQHEPGLATALHNLGSHLAGLGRREAAIAATREAAYIREFLAREKAEVYEPVFARSLDNLATDHFQLGAAWDALATAERAVTIHQRLTRRSRTHSPILAASLHNLGRYLAHVERWRDAAAVTQQAVSLFQSLVNKGQVKFEADLAAALHDLGSYQHELGTLARGAVTASSAVQIRQRLAATNPIRFEPDLALSHMSLANQLSDLGQPFLAEMASNQAIDISRRLTIAAPDMHDANHATVQHNRAIHLARSGKTSEALEAAQQAVNIRSILTESYVTSFEHLLFDTLTAVGVVIPGRTEQASEHRLNGWRLVTSAKLELSDFLAPATDRLQRAVDDVFAANVPGGAHSSENLGIRLFRADRLTMATAAMAPGVMARLAVPARELRRREAELARSLGNLSSRHAETNNPWEALVRAEQAANAFHRLTAAHPSDYRRDFAVSLANLGQRLLDVGRPHDALTATAAAVSTLGPAHGPLWASTQTASILLSFAWVRRATRTEMEAALHAVQQAAGIYRDLGRVEPESFAPMLQSTRLLEWEMVFELARANGSISARRAGTELAKSVLRMPAHQSHQGVYPRLAAAGRY